MPRAMVAPGSASKFSCSSASSCRGANLSCCATSARASPRASRAAASSCPTPVSSVIGSPLQRLVLGRLRIAPAQLVGERLLLQPVAELALDAQREPQRLRARIDQLIVARDELASVAHVALAVADLAEVEERRWLVGLEPQRALEKRLGVLRLRGLQAAYTCRRIGAPRRRIERVADRVQEILDRRRFAPGLAQEPAVVVVDVGVVGREPQGPLEALLGAGGFLELHVDQAVHAVRRGVARIGRLRDAKLFQRDAVIRRAVVKRGELGMELRAVTRLAHLADDRPGVVGGILVLRAGGYENEQGRCYFFHALTSLRTVVRRVRSATSPAS